MYGMQNAQPAASGGAQSTGGTAGGCGGLTGGCDGLTPSAACKRTGEGLLTCSVCCAGALRCGFGVLPREEKLRPCIICGLAAQGHAVAHLQQGSDGDQSQHGRRPR